MDQQSLDWYTSRIGRITASRVGQILGLSPYGSREDAMRAMVREHHGAESEFIGNIATEYGTRHEPFAIMAFTEKYGIEVQKSGFVVHPEHDFLGASPDGIILDFSEGVLEVKCPYNQTPFKLADRPDYYAQVQLQCACTGLKYAYFGVWTPEASQFEYVEADPEWLIAALPTLQDFHREYLAIIADPKRSTPYLEDKVQERTDADWQLAAAEYLSRKAIADAANKELEAAKETLLALAKEAGKPCRGLGVQVIRSERQGAIDAKAAATAGVDLESFRKAPSVVWSVRGASE